MKKRPFSIPSTTFENISDEGRTYAKRIRFFKDSITADPYLVILYNKGVVKGEIYWVDDLCPTPQDNPGTLDMLKVFYDGSISHPVLEVSVELVPGLTENETYPTTAFYRGVYDYTIAVSGGIGYHYVFDPDEDPTNPDDYDDDHVYMYKGITDETGEMAKVALYFPLADVAVNPDDMMEINDMMLHVVYEWVKYTNNSDIRAVLGAADRDIDTDGIQPIRYDSEANLLADLTQWESGHPGNTSVDLIFILGLSNPIAFNATDGYVANDLIPADYNDLGDLDAGVSWTMTPAAIWNLAITVPN